ncbi:MAG: hypothetical protein ACRDZO_00190 [Egibacteraceae bacterium]
MGIAAGPDGGLLVADTLNHKIKHFEPYTRGMRTLLGDGTPLDAALAELERRPAAPTGHTGARMVPGARGAGMGRSATPRHRHR